MVTENSGFQQTASAAVTHLAVALTLVRSTA